MFVLLCLCLLTMPFAHSQLQIHRLMTADEVMGIFHTTPDAVPDYELVPVMYSIKNAHEHGTTKVRVKAFDQEFELRLNTTGGYLVGEDTPLWTVASNDQTPGVLQYNLIPDALEDIGLPMHDEDSGAAVLVTQRNNERHIFNGFLPANIVIRSLPKRLTKNVLYGENGLFKNHFSGNVTSDGFIHSYHHIVYKKVPKKEHENFHITNPLSRMYDIPDAIYPEVLAVIDYSLYTMLGRNIELAKRYIIAFWNGVDMRYRALTNPKIRLNIAGIIIATDEGAVPYIGNSKYGSNMVDADKALHAMGSYFYKERRFPWKMYDIAMCNTKLNLCNMVGGALCDPSTLGYAYVGGACNRNHTTKLSHDVGIAEDDGGFSGIIPTVHELGHLLGAHHDGLAKDTKDCSASSGNIMSGTLQFSENEFSWSNCSIREFHKFLSEDRAKCLYDAPPEATAIRRILPGKLMSPDEQCKQSYGGGSCNKDSSSMCYELKCLVPGTNGLCMPIAAAADGSCCGNGLICLGGECVLEGSETKNEKALV